ncbi:MAG TPA: YfhO family protein [Elusimicrobiales bacterium]|nr:YfhO family protein [Elusimicrobiales bacterium]
MKSDGPDIAPDSGQENSAQARRDPSDGCLAGKERYLLAALLCLTGFFIFRDFLLLKNVYLFKDIGSDSVNFLYPQLIHLSQYIKHEGLPGWSFSQGMGQNIFPFMLSANTWTLLWPLQAAALPYGIVFAEFLKVFLSGVFFFLYLGTLPLSAFAALAGAVMFAFSGYIVLGSCWSVFSYEAMCAALLLYSFERLYKRGDWKLAPAAVALMGVCQPFYWFSYAIFFFLYTAFRFAQDPGPRHKSLPLFYLKLLALGLLGAAVSAVFSLSNIAQMLQSPRVAGGSSYFKQLLSQPVFTPAPLSELASSVYRSFSSDMLGTGSNFRGAINYLEAPLFYCGLANLLLAPQFLYFADRKRKALSVLVLLLCLLPVIFPFFRYAFWGFTGNYYRTLSLLITLCLMFFSLQALSAVGKTGKAGLLLLAGTLAALLLVLFAPGFYAKLLPVEPGPRSIAAVFLAIYSVLIGLMGLKRFKPGAQALFLAAICVEAAVFSSVTVNTRPVISAEELGRKTGYNDHSAEAVAWLNAGDPGFFRTAKLFSSGPAIHGSINDALVQGYMGTASYHSFNQEYYVRFLHEMGALNAADENQTRWITGLERPVFRTFLLALGSVKYALTREPAAMNGAGYYLKNSFGDVSVFQSAFFLPLGFTYDKYIGYEDFKKLKGYTKDITLLRAFVPGDGDRDKFPGIAALTGQPPGEPLTFNMYSGYINALKKEALSLTGRSRNRLAGEITVSGKKLLFFSIPYDKGWKARVDGSPAELKLVNIGFMGLPLEKGKHRIELEFTPPLLYAGALISAAGLLLYGALAWHSARKRRVIA